VKSHERGHATGAGFSVSRGFEFYLTFLEFPDPLRTKIKTDNLIEICIEEMRLTIIPMRSFNNTNSVERAINGNIAIGQGKCQNTCPLLHLHTANHRMI
jgi:transposase-like protein